MHAFKASSRQLVYAFDEVICTVVFAWAVTKITINEVND